MKPMSSTRSRTRMAIAALALFALSGCATLSNDGGFGPVQQAAKDRLGKEVKWARSDADRDAIDKRVAKLLEQPLSVEDAVQIAVLNNKGLQASFSELGISEADRVQAGRPPNPGFSFGRLTQGSSVEIDRGIQFNLARLLMLPMVNQIRSESVV